MTERTEHGFRIGAIEATALMEAPKGHAAVGIRVGHTKFDVVSSPKGQNVLIAMHEGDGVLRIIAPNGIEIAVRWFVKYGGSVTTYRDGRYLKGIDL